MAFFTAMIYDGVKMKNGTFKGKRKKYNVNTPFHKWGKNWWILGANDGIPKSPKKNSG